MTQAELAAKLQQKLGFKTEIDSTKLTTLDGSPLKRRPLRVKSESKRTSKKKSFALLPPDDVVVAPRPLQFNKDDKTVYAQQSVKVFNETGLDARLQRALVRDHLDAEVATLIFYCHKIAKRSSDQGTIGLLCDYIDLAINKLGSEAPSGFWTAARSKYIGDLLSLRRAIDQNRRLVSTPRTAGCINNFLEYLRTTWSVN